MVVRPLALELPKVSRSHARQFSAVARAVPLKSLAGLMDELARLVDLEVRHGETTVSYSPTFTPGPANACACFVVGLGPQNQGDTLVDLEPRIAEYVAERLLGGEDAHHVPAPVAPMGHFQRGVLAYAAAHLLYRCVDAPLCLRTVITEPAVRDQLIRDRLPAWTTNTTLYVAPLSGHLTIHSPFPWIPADRPLPNIPITVVVDVARDLAPWDQCQDLMPGDVWVPAQVPLDPKEPHVRRAWLLALGSHTPFGMAVIQGGRIELEHRSASWDHGSGAGRTHRSEEASMADDHFSEERTKSMAGTTQGGLQDATVHVHVEVARFRMPLVELTRLAAGEVVSTGIEPNQRVSLRVGDTTFAKGELVDVDGEMGVRILELVTEP